MPRTAKGKLGMDELVELLQGLRLPAVVGLIFGVRYLGLLQGLKAPARV